MLAVSISTVRIAFVPCCRYLEKLDMQAAISAHLAVANGEHLDNTLSVVLATFAGIVQVSETTF